MDPGGPCHMFDYLGYFPSRPGNWPVNREKFDSAIRFFNESGKPRTYLFNRDKKYIGTGQKSNPDNLSGIYDQKGIFYRPYEKCQISDLVRAEILEQEDRQE